MNKKKFSYAIITLLSMAITTTGLAQDKNESVRLASTNENHQLFAGITGSWAFKGRHTFAGSRRKPIEFMSSMVRSPLWDNRYFTSGVTGQDIPMALGRTASWLPCTK